MTEANRSTPPATIAIPPLTPEQQARAEALYRHLERLRLHGVRQVLITITRPHEPMRVGPVGRRVEIH